MKWLKSVLSPKNWFRKLKSFFLVMDGGKEVLHKSRLMLVSILVTAVGAGIALYFGQQQDTSFFIRSDRRISQAGAAKQQAAPAPGSSGTGHVEKMLGNSASRSQERPPRQSHGQGVKINYKAQQVLISEGAFDPNRTMPMGTNLIGKTLTTIDTRFAEQLVKVLLPYGGRANTGGELPKNSILFGQIVYGGKGEKVSIKFSKGVLPTGQEFQVEAQALSPGDFSPGLVGEFHGNADMRVASTLGLTMVAGMSDVLTEKESLGGGGLLPGAVTPKATMKNAMYHGVSQVAQAEASRQAESIGQEQEYVTVEAGTDVIVSLTKAYIEK